VDGFSYKSTVTTITVWSSEPKKTAPPDGEAA